MSSTIGPGWEGVGCQGELLSFLPIFCSLFWPSLEGHCFFLFGFKLKKKYLVRSKVVTVSKRKEWIFMYQAIFSFLWLLKTCPVVVERMEKKKNWFGKRVNSIFKVKWVICCRVTTKVKMCVCLFVWLGIKSSPFSSSTGPNYFHINKLCVLDVNFRQNSIGQLNIS